MDITDAYISWLTVVRKACPHAKCFCIVPHLGWHMSQVRAAVDARNEAGDKNVYVIDTALLKDGFHPGPRPSVLACDGVHPTLYGHAMLGALIAAEVQKVLSSPK
jgi:hypothetical protein